MTEGYDLANQVLHHFGQGGFPPGSFVAALLLAFDRADAENFDRLRQGFPEVAAVFSIGRAGRFDTLAEMGRYAA